VAALFSGALGVGVLNVRGGTTLDALFSFFFLSFPDFLV